MIRRTAEQDNFLALLLVHLGDLLLGVEPKPREVAVFVLGELRCPTLVESGGNDAEFEVGYEIGANIRIVFEEQMPFVVFFYERMVLAEFLECVIKGLDALHDVFRAEHLLAEEIFEHLLVIGIAFLVGIEQVVFLDVNIVSVHFQYVF